MKNIFKGLQYIYHIGDHLQFIKHLKPIIDETIRNQNKIVLISIAFNNTQVLTHQIRLISKYLRDDFIFIIADNSSDKKKKAQIRDLCNKNDITYISLPQKKQLKRKGSVSHGAALNLLFTHYILKANPKYFGFIDHDIYPVRRCSIIDHLNTRKVFGLVQRIHDIWYLWPGFCFFEYNAIQNIKMNFLPGIIDGNRVDTGALNWLPLYKNINKLNLIIPDHETHMIDKNSSLQESGYEIIGEWIHTYNASQWMPTADKTEIIDKLLNQY